MGEHRQDSGCSSSLSSFCPSSSSSLPLEEGSNHDANDPPPRKQQQHQEEEEQLPEGDLSPRARASRRRSFPAPPRKGTSRSKSSNALVTTMADSVADPSSSTAARASSRLGQRRRCSTGSCAGDHKSNNVKTSSNNNNKEISNPNTSSKHNKSTAEKRSKDRKKPSRSSSSNVAVTASLSSSSKPLSRKNKHQRSKSTNSLPRFDSASPENGSSTTTTNLKQNKSQPSQSSLLDSIPEYQDSNVPEIKKPQQQQQQLEPLSLSKSRHHPKPRRSKSSSAALVVSSTASAVEKSSSFKRPSGHGPAPAAVVAPQPEAHVAPLSVQFEIVVDTPKTHGPKLVIVPGIEVIDDEEEDVVLEASPIAENNISSSKGKSAKKSSKSKKSSKKKSSGSSRDWSFRSVRSNDGDDGNNNKIIDSMDLPQATIPAKAMKDFNLTPATASPTDSFISPSSDNNYMLNEESDLDNDENDDIVQQRMPVVVEEKSASSSGGSSDQSRKQKQQMRVLQQSFSSVAGTGGDSSSLATSSPLSVAGNSSSFTPPFLSADSSLILMDEDEEASFTREQDWDWLESAVGHNQAVDRLDRTKGLESSNVKGVKEQQQPGVIFPSIRQKSGDGAAIYQIQSPRAPTRKKSMEQDASRGRSQVVGQDLLIAPPSPGRGSEISISTIGDGTTGTTTGDGDDTIAGSEHLPESNLDDQNWMEGSSEYETSSESDYSDGGDLEDAYVRDYVERMQQQRMQRKTPAPSTTRGKTTDSPDLLSGTKRADDDEDGVQAYMPSGYILSHTGRVSQMLHKIRRQEPSTPIVAKLIKRQEPSTPQNAIQQPTTTVNALEDGVTPKIGNLSGLCPSTSPRPPNRNKLMEGMQDSLNFTDLHLTMGQVLVGQDSVAGSSLSASTATSADLSYQSQRRAILMAMHKGGSGSHGSSLASSFNQSLTSINEDHELSGEQMELLELGSKVSPRRGKRPSKTKSPLPTKDGETEDSSPRFPQRKNSSKASRNRSGPPLYGPSDDDDDDDEEEQYRDDDVPRRVAGSSHQNSVVSDFSDDPSYIAQPVRRQNRFAHGEGSNTHLFELDFVAQAAEEEFSDHITMDSSVEQVESRHPVPEMVNKKLAGYAISKQTKNDMPEVHADSNALFLQLDFAAQAGPGQVQYADNALVNEAAAEEEKMPELDALEEDEVPKVSSSKLKHVASSRKQLGNNVNLPAKKDDPSSSLRNNDAKLPPSRKKEGKERKRPGVKVTKSAGTVDDLWQFGENSRSLLPPADTEDIIHDGSEVSVTSRHSY